ncbi:nucleotide pyrophosphohydrolase [Paenibacillus arenosi]|uniref:Nucleotide pyrophosphohydrolase n=1 Tax=Paenibacillus arenosi TaxID=2774142 RepID=A0ABR9AU15_9BACL|nr:nucleotide pyrophosphohydrolase [Paenibacillus arenosi]MBD8497594.1 nucleotide pyrophosphohydrolase [Paenibacillus arenosi]
MSDHQHPFSLKDLRDKPLAEMQREVDQYISQFKEGYFSPLAMLARLTEEAGELAREVNHFYGEKPKKSSEADNSIEMELGDVLFILICFANSLGIDLTEAHDKVMDKFNTRDANRWTRIDEASNVEQADNGKVDEK